MNRRAALRLFCLCVAALAGCTQREEPATLPMAASAFAASSSDQSVTYQLNRAPDSRPRFGSDECTEDCSGHQAGYDWAEKHDIVDEDDCGANSQSFREGCMERVEEQESSRRGSDDDDAPDVEEQE